jgi:hypothetical protein
MDSLIAGSAKEDAWRRRRKQERGRIRGQRSSTLLLCFQLVVHYYS